CGGIILIALKLAMSANHGAICTRNNCSPGNSSLIGESRAEGVSFSSLERWSETGFSTPFLSLISMSNS
ncbi:hypothetical protein PIB30_105658, partial [Stylosanthes scabra]|nr:hypothetical protein [Stylosanthes scabra]